MLTQMVDNRVYDYSYNVGGREMGGDVALAIGQNDEVYCLCRAGGINNLVHVIRISVGKKSGDEEIVGVFGSYGTGNGQFIWPTGIAIDEKSNLYITDEWVNRITVMDREGRYLHHWGTPGNDTGQLNGPAGIGIDAEGVLYVVDSLNHRIQKFSSEGKYIDSWGGYGVHPGEFDSPWGLTIDKDGFVYVADHKNHRVQKFSSSGEYLMEFGSYGTGRGYLNRPTDIAVDPEGDVYICDWANNAVKVFEPGGSFVTSFIGDAQALSKWFKITVNANDDVFKARRRVDTLEPEWRLALPCGVAFDEVNSRVMIADTQRRRIQIYNKLHDYIGPQINL